MSDEQVSTVPRRRGQAEAEQLVTEYEASGLTRREFCRVRGLSVSALDAYRKRRRLVQRETAGGAQWVAVEVSNAKQPEMHAPTSGLALVLARGRRIEVGHGFDSGTLQQLVRLLERL